MRWNRTVSALLSMMVIVAVSGCAPESAGPQSLAERVVRGVPETWTGPPLDPLDGSPEVGWLSDAEFGVVTRGSSSCPPVAISLERTEEGDVRIEFADSPHDTCTADDGPTTHVLRLPDGVDERPVAVTLTFASGGTYSLSLP
ncbi:hypothetical protein GCM10017586_28980 [Microbacterium imperiale]|uniref:Uncharacterized protein n=1 Tax=Microbacterium imperiale TaxID=33884 RepID=A0A9W6HIM5_9MICO|nr:hypothetical protein GCM10017544_01810 [Microbacterium imperiale]GLJ81215.1 hypothetical protein GCM10017586_28980 [Microbacterium imperiale]